MKEFLKTIDWISDKTGKGVSYLVIFLTAVILYEIFARYLFKSPTIWVHEVAQMIYGAYVLLLGAYAMKQGVHVNVDVLYGKFSPRTRATINLFTWLLFFFFCGLIMVKGWEMASESFDLGETAPTPFAPVLWPVKMTIPAGALLILLQGLAKIVRDLHLVVTGVLLEKEEGHEH